MKLFAQRELKEAYLFAEAGGQALTLGKGCARLVDHNLERLYGTARRLGVLHVKPQRIAKAGQHVVMRGLPLDRAVEESKTEELPL